MRKFVLLTLVFALALMAHSPNEVKAEFDLETKILEITIDHPVKGDGHYVDEITVKLNGEEIIVQKIDIQEDREKQTALYKITQAKSGDEIEITANCNKFGKEKVELVVE